ncbi:MAG: hypothetical protein WAU61_12325 [Smithella sp.]
MKKEGNHSQETDKKLAAVCGLYCEACPWFIAATEDPEMFKSAAKNRVAIM